MQKPIKIFDFLLHNKINYVNLCATILIPKGIQTNLTWPIPANQSLAIRISTNQNWQIRSANRSARFGTHVRGKFKFHGFIECPNLPQRESAQTDCPGLQDECDSTAELRREHEPNFLYFESKVKLFSSWLLRSYQV
jgi:hypothetical protein